MDYNPGNDRVSIHAFRGEGDHPFYYPVRPQGSSFNPRLPGGRRRVHPVSVPIAELFQSTPSGGKATSGNVYFASSNDVFQSTPSGGKATGERGVFVVRHNNVSIHAFRGEGDVASCPNILRAACFNPRLPGGRRRFSGREERAAHYVSIHAFRGEGDAATAITTTTSVTFQSTPSGGKATTGVR